jgi:hypothetical protein
MDNFNRPAHPQPIAFSGDNTNAQTSWGVHTDFAGFTKLELASLMIAQGYIAAGAFKDDDQEGYEIARCSVHVAKAVLEEANK